ncbi:MAG: hypothetical protein RIS44_1566 [Pseudomonadota bacterium]|jgi:putative flippase GtrA
MNRKPSKFTQASPKPEHTGKQFARFLLVGLANTALGLSVIYASKYWLSLHDAAANALGYTIGLILSFTLNRRWTFKETSNKSLQTRVVLRFLAASLLGYGLNLLAVMLGIHGLHLNAYLAQCVGIPPYTLTVYWLCKTWVFTSDEQTA